MVKSVSCCCVRGSMVFSDLVTYYVYKYMQMSSYVVSQQQLISTTANKITTITKAHRYNKYMNITTNYNTKVVKEDDDLPSIQLKWRTMGSALQ